MSSIKQIQDELIEEFGLLEGDREMASFYIMELGEKMPAFPEEFRNDDNLVKGCQSKVWLKPELIDDKIVFHADSNAAITKGLVSLLVRVLSGQTPDQILNAELYFVRKINMDRFIGTQRSNGFASMMKQIKLYALAFQTKITS